MQLYRGIIKRALNITWRSKYLWFFGLFAALLSNGGEYEILLQALLGNFGNGFFSNFQKVVQTGIFSRQWLHNLGDMLISQPISVIIALLLLVVFVVLFVFVLWLINVSQAALVKNALLEIDGKKTPFRDLLDFGIKKFWPVFGFNVISKFITMISLMIISFIVVWSSGLGSIKSAIIYSSVVLLFIPVAMSFSFVVKYSIGYLVINDMKFVDSFKSGWNLFSKNWLISLEMAFLLYIINIIIAVLFILVVLILMTPFALLIFLASILAMNEMFLFVLGLGVIFFFALLFVIGSLVSVFQISVWTSLFVELISGGFRSKLIRVFNR